LQRVILVFHSSSTYKVYSFQYWKQISLESASIVFIDSFILFGFVSCVLTLTVDKCQHSCRKRAK